MIISINYERTESWRLWEVTQRYVFIDLVFILFIFSRKGYDEAWTCPHGFIGGHECVDCRH